MLDFLNESLKGRCLFAIPKKGDSLLPLLVFHAPDRQRTDQTLACGHTGRLYEKCLQLLAGTHTIPTRLSTNS